MKSMYRMIFMKKYLAILLMATSSFYACGGGSGAGSNNADISPNDSQTAPASEASALHFAGGVTLEIPAGALETDTEITVTALDQADGVSDARGSIFRFEPAGIQFLEPVKLILPFSQEQFSSDETPVVAFSLENDSSTFETIDTRNSGDGTVNAAITHFSMAYVKPYKSDESQCGQRLRAVIEANPEGKKYVYGKALFLAGSYRPMRGVAIIAELTDDEQASTNTDENGCYALSIDTSQTLVSLKALPYSYIGSGGDFPQSCSDGNLAVVATFNGSTIDDFKVEAEISDDDKNSDLAVVSLYVSSQSATDVFDQDDLNLAFGLVDSSAALADTVCQADADVMIFSNTPAIVFRLGVSDGSDTRFSQVSGAYEVVVPESSYYDFNRGQDVYEFGAHHFFHIMQSELGLQRDVAQVLERQNYDHHPYHGLLDARYSFYEGLADALAATIVANEFGTHDFDGTQILYADGLWRIPGVAQALYHTISQYGYPALHDVLQGDFQASPAFQTLHSFGYYMQNSNVDTTFLASYAGVPDLAMADLFDRDNKIGETLGSQYALYPTIVTYGFLEGFYWDGCPPSSGHVVVGDPSFEDSLACYGGDEEEKHYYTTTAEANTSQVRHRYYSSARSDDFGPFYYDDVTSHAYLYDLGFLPLPLTPAYDAKEHDTLQITVDIADFFPPAFGTRWYLMDGSFYGTQDDYDNLEPGTELSQTTIFRIADDGASEGADCDHNLNMDFYMEGELFSSTEGPCPIQTDLPQGETVVEVWSANATEDVDCFSFMDEHTCSY